MREYEKNIPCIRTNRRDLDRILGLCACLQECQMAAEEMEKRFRAVPNGWRDLKLVISLLNKLVDNVLLTVPPEKLASMQRMMPRMKFKLVCGPQASQAGNDECIISSQEADTLANFAHEYCMTCANDTACNQCLLGKVLDNIMTYDRDGRSWAYVDFRVIRKEYADEQPM